jgi:hypothetical protein
MSAGPNDLALQYLLRLSSDIRSAIVLHRGELVAAAPGSPDAELTRTASELVESAAELSNGSHEPVEVDALCGGETVYVIADGEWGMICVAHRLSLPGIVLHEMRSTFRQLEGRSA